MIPVLHRRFGSAASKGAAGSLYDILKVSQTSSADEIKKAYKKAALEHHPDRGGDVDKFKEISSAYSVLSDPEKRAVYDKFGDAAMAEGGNNGFDPRSQGFDPMDIFSQAFGGSARRDHPGGLARGRDAIYKLELSLDEIFEGASRSIAYNRDVGCKPCGGRGATKIDPCRRCGGSGVVLTKQNIGFLIHMQTACPECEGQGYKVPKGGLCGPCHGSGVVSEKEKFQVNIPPGCPSGHQIRFHGKGDHLPGHTAGDIVVQVVEKPGTVVKRVGANSPDICMQKSVSLADAIAGVHVDFTHLGDKKIVKLMTGQEGTGIVAPGDVWVAKGLGLPRYEGTTKGDLYVKFDVLFPKNVTQMSDMDREKILKTIAEKSASKTTSPVIQTDNNTILIEKISSNETILKIKHALDDTRKPNQQEHRRHHQAHPQECQQQ